MTDINGTDNINPSPGEADSPWAPAGPLAAGADVRRPHLKGWHAAIIVIAVLALLGIGGYTVVNQVFHHQEQARIQKEEEHLQEYRKIAHSEECRKLIEKRLKRMDPEALTDSGVIKSYKINDSSIENNPMAGFSFTVIINNDKRLTTEFIVDKPSYTFDHDHPDGQLTDDVEITSQELEDLLEARYGKDYLDK
ncbi:MAG: DUF1310 family protein [Scardovia wiggsiae]|uniref:DUF1310 family protein n=1 Tax=Scardovia wiggsiae TaxID=230143 RepID=UPI001CABC9E9|nr:DUF1310 family protein [Scardovia wiggsiae]